MKQLAIGIDIGGTNTVFGLVDKDGNCLAENKISTTGFEDINDYIRELSTSIKQLISSLKEEHEIIGIGIGAPNGNYFSGTVENAPNLKWKGSLKFKDLFWEYFNYPVILTNDANAAAIGEMIYGAAKGMKDFVVVTLGTGVGSGFVSNGELIYGNDGFAGELGHTIIFPEGRQCGCGTCCRARRARACTTDAFRNLGKGSSCSGSSCWPSCFFCSSARFRPGRTAATGVIIQAADSAWFWWSPS